VGEIFPGIPLTAAGIAFTFHRPERDHTMRKAFLKASREKLLAMRRETLREMSDELREGRDGSKEEGMDTYDLASEERDREIKLILTDRERDKVKNIQDALDRIEEGTYGVCEDCESDIAEGRLNALPVTRLCISCQADHEKEARSSRRYDDDRAYRRLGATDIDEENA
jgi:DnaK suppressor protein